MDTDGHTSVPMKIEHNPLASNADDSDSDDDHLFYGNPESNIAHFTADSLKRGNSVPESYIGDIAADSLKQSFQGRLVREGHIGDRAIDSMKIKQPAHHNFSFHNFGYHPTPFSDLMSTIVTMRDSYNKTKELYQATHPKDGPRRTHTKKEFRNEASMFSIKDFQKTQAKTHTNNKISRFREAPLKWDMSAPDEKLLKELYRTCESDPSGKRIFDLARDEAKGATPWRPAEFDKDIAPPTLSSLSPPFQKMLLQHMDSVVAQVQAEYDKLPAKTQAQGEIKAGVGADLANLRRKRDILRSDIKNAEDSEADL